VTSSYERPFLAKFDAANGPLMTVGAGTLSFFYTFAGGAYFFGSTLAGDLDATFALLLIYKIF
jgi:hypothetical protein